MNEIIMQYVREYGMAALTSLLATGGCLAGSGCATKVISLGAVSDQPVFTLDLPGMSMKVHSLEMTFEHAAETVEP